MSALFDDRFFGSNYFLSKFFLLKPTIHTDLTALYMLELFIKKANIHNIAIIFEFFIFMVLLLALFEMFSLMK